MTPKQMLTFFASLTQRQQQVLTLASEGQTNREIGQTLHIQPSVVAEHLTTIYDRLHMFLNPVHHARPNRRILLIHYGGFFTIYPELRHIKYH